MRTTIRLTLLALAFSCAATFGCSSSDEPVTKPDPQMRDAGNQPSDAYSEVGVPVVADPCKAHACGSGTCKVSNGKAVCSCKSGFDNQNGIDNVCVACTEMRSDQPVDINVPAASVMLVFLKDGKPIESPGPNSIYLKSIDGIFSDFVNNIVAVAVPLGKYRAYSLGSLGNIAGYEAVPKTFDLGAVEVTAETTALRLELPRVVPIVARLPLKLGSVFLAHESGVSYQLFLKDDKAKYPFGVETSPDLEGQFSFYGPPGKYEVVKNVTVFEEGIGRPVNTLYEERAMAALAQANVEMKPLATFEAPTQGVTSPIAIDLPVFNVDVTLKVNDGAIPCDRCAIRLFSHNGTYAVGRNQAGQRSVKLPAGTYFAMVSGAGEPPSTRAVDFFVEGGLVQVTKDQTVDLSIKLVKVSGKVSIVGADGMSLRPKITEVLMSDPPASRLSYAITNPLSDGSYALWLAPKASYRLKMSAYRDAGQGGFSEEKTVEVLQTDLNAVNFDIKLKKVSVKLNASAGLPTQQLRFNIATVAAEAGPDGTLVELPLGKHSPDVNWTDMKNSANFLHLPQVEVSDNPETIEIRVNPVKFSGKVRIGSDPIRDVRWSSTGPGVLDKPTTTARAKVIPTEGQGDFSNLWLLPGQYRAEVPSNSYLGCFLVKPQ